MGRRQCCRDEHVVWASVLIPSALAGCPGELEVIGARMIFEEWLMDL